MSWATSAVDGSSKATLFLRADAGFFFFIDGSKSISSPAGVVVVAIFRFFNSGKEIQRIGSREKSPVSGNCLMQDTCL